MTEKHLNIYEALEQSVPVSYENQDFNVQPLENPFTQQLVPVEEIDTGSIQFPTAKEMDKFAQAETSVLAERMHAFADFDVGLSIRQREIVERAGQLIISASIRTFRNIRML